jgi:integrase
VAPLWRPPIGPSTGTDAPQDRTRAQRNHSGRKLEITDPWLKVLRPQARPVEYRDTRQRGLVLRVEPSGRKTWVARYSFAGRDRRFRIGAYPETTLAKARKRAHGLVAQAEAGNDPQIERERLRAGETVALAVGSWLADEKLGPGAKWKGGTEGGTARSFMPHVRAFQSEMGDRRLPELGARNVERFVSLPEAAATRNRRLTALRSFFAWAIRKGLLEADPSAGLEKERETERSRTLTDAELAALIRGYDATRYGRAVRLLALTGLRRDEVLGARWEWLDTEAETLTIPPAAEKTGALRGEPRRVALSKAAVALLAGQRKAQLAEGSRSEWIFATKPREGAGTRPHADALKPTLNVLRGRRANGLPLSKDPRASKREAVLPSDVSIHDIRRTVADVLLNRLKVAPWIVDHVVLGHVRPKTLRTCMPTLPLAEAREALSRWAAEVARLLGEPVPKRKNARA